MLYLLKENKILLVHRLYVLKIQNYWVANASQKQTKEDANNGMLKWMFVMLMETPQKMLLHKPPQKLLPHKMLPHRLFATLDTKLEDTRLWTLNHRIQVFHNMVINIKLMHIAQNHLFVQDVHYYNLKDHQIGLEFIHLILVIIVMLIIMKLIIIHQKSRSNQFVYPIKIIYMKEKFLAIQIIL